MLTLRLLGPYVLAFVVLMSGFIATGVWHVLDYYVYSRLYLDPSQPPTLGRDFVLIDMTEKPVPVEAYRLRIADLLVRLAANGKQPDVIVLDTWFGNDASRIPELTSALTVLRDNRAAVYAVFNPTAGGEGLAFEQQWEAHAKNLYHQQMLKGYGHNLLDMRDGVLSYEGELEIGSGEAGTTLVAALPVRIARDRGWRGTIPSGKLVVPVGSQNEVTQRTFEFAHADGKTSGGTFLSAAHPVEAPNLQGKIVVVGNTKYDRHPKAPQAGPNLMLWALSERRNGDAVFSRPLNQPLLILTQTLFFALSTALVFAVLFKYVRRWQTRPVLIATVAAASGTATLCVFVAFMLALRYVAPIGIAIFAIVLTAVLAWRFALIFLVSAHVEGSGKYAAFISYSSRQRAWVIEHVYEPLKAAGLEVFLDRERIPLGGAFTRHYSQAIIDSRFFIPIYSRDYWKSNHCRNEMSIADYRRVEQHIRFLPLTYDAAAVLERYRHLNYMDARANPAFIEQIIATIRMASPTA